MHEWSAGKFHLLLGNLECVVDEFHFVFVAGLKRRIFGHKGGRTLGRVSKSVSIVRIRRIPEKGQCTLSQHCTDASSFRTTYDINHILPA